MERVAHSRRGAAESSQRSVEQLDKAASKKNNPSWPWVVTATAACLMLVGMLVYRIQANRPIVTITGSNGPLHWTGDGGMVDSDVEAGQALKAGTLESLSTDSWVELEFLDGSTVTLSGHSTLTFSGRKRKTLHLRRGNMSASVEKQLPGMPMTIHTPTASLEVLGTQFNVDTELSTTTCAVNEGRVRVTRLADGESAEVTADHQVVAAASRADLLEVTPRRIEVNAWHSEIPVGKRYGKWNPQTTELSASPLLWRSRRKKGKYPLLLYLAALSVSREGQPPVAIAAGAEFRVKGRMDSRADLYFGMATKHLKGGFAGKHYAVRKAELIPGNGETFEFTIPIEEFKPEEPEHPESPLGLELQDCWCLTINHDAGLAITSIELIPSAHD